MRSLPPAQDGRPPAPAAPQGPDVAFVMTDIEGSTALWERAPEAMGEAVLIHNALVRAHLATHGGYEIKSEGDAFALAFPEPVAALRWCLAVTDALARERWSSALSDAEDRVGVRVRIGMHVGEPMRHTDPVTGRVDYLGPAMNRAARVSGAGHGGQILLSDAAWRTLEPALPELGLVVEDLGLYTLRGISTPERLRLVRPASQGQRRTPPLRASRWRPNSPLAGRDQFIGRAADLANIHSHLMSCRLLTLKGPGGTGKTRLARRYGAEQEADWPGGVIFCDLTEARSGEAALAAARRALDLPATAGDAEVGAALAGRGRTLLLLDNLEQVVEEIAPHVEAWLNPPSPSAILVTSRRPLALPGERVLEIAPLSLPPADATRPEDLLAAEAAQLYVERASERGAPLTLGAQTCADIAALVRRLDGLPLAIELAAAWSRLLSPAAVLERVARQLDPLGRAGDGRVSRQATLGAVVAWSWELLSPWEQAAFAQLSVFEGGCTVRLAERVVDLSAFPDAPPLAEVLERLVEHSLIYRDDGRTRILMLSTLQDFARARLNETPGERDAAERRHGEAMMRLLGASPPRGRGLRLAPSLRAERENLGLAARRALERGDVAQITTLGGAAVELLMNTGPYSEALALARARGAATGLSPKQRAWVVLDLGEALRNLGQAAEARLHLEDALALARSEGEEAQLAATLLALGVLEHDLRHFDRARACYEDALRYAASLPDPTAHIRALTCLGHIERETGAHERAERHLRRALTLCPAEDRSLHLRTLSALSLLQMERGSPIEAARTLREVVALAQAEGDRVLEVIARGNLSEALAEQGRLDDALAASQRVMPRARALGSRRLLAINLGNQGDILLRLGRIDEAERALREAIELSRQLGLRDALGAFMGTLGALLAQRGEADEGWALLESGGVELRTINNLLELLRLRVRQIRVGQATGRPVAPLLEEARALSATLDLSPRAPLARELLELSGERATRR